MRNSRITMVSFLLVLVMILGFASVSLAYPTAGEIGGDVIDSLMRVGKTVVNEVVDTASKLISQLFNDIKESDWYAVTVKKLVDLGGIIGYPDGTFKPDKQITRAEFTKILVSALGYEDLSPSSSHWASGYVDKALSINLASKDELISLDRAITRKEMAKMVSNALDHRGESHNEDRASYKSLVKDYNSIDRAYQDYVLKAYTKGIITGYPDGSFGPERGLTRAEASTVIIRVLDKSERKVPNLPTTPTLPVGGSSDFDLKTIVLKSNIDANLYEKGERTHNTDFQLLIQMWEDLEPQYKDVENIFKARFGNAREIDEIMAYIKMKKIRADELKDKWWMINGQKVYVGSNPNSQSLDVTCWYVK